MIQNAHLEYCRQSFENSDYYHYLISLFMPLQKRPALWTLGAFKNVIESIPASVTEPSLGYMRLTWWRDQIDLLQQSKLTKGQPVLSALNEYCHACESRDLIAFINEHETLIENPDTVFTSEAYSHILEKILGSDYAKYRKLENKLTAILKKYHGTKWEAHPPLLALRLWWVSIFA